MMSTQRMRLAIILVQMLLAGIRLQASTAWFGGGSYDGYDDKNAGAGMSSLQLHNGGGATNIGSTSAFLNGMLLYSGSAPASVTVYWGKSDGGTDTGSWTYNHAFGEVAERVPLTHQATLDPGSTYYYRFFGQNTASETGWAPSSFLFATPTSPVVSAGLGALPVGRESATLNGELVAGLIAEIEFSWGRDPDPENWDPGDVVSLGERSEGALFLTVGGLTPGMTYYYRIRAENEYGVDVLDPLVEFTTVSGLAWFGGGSYDGYDDMNAGAGMSSLQLHNGGGATNISSTSAFLNGMLLYSGSTPASVTVFWGKSDGGTDTGSWTYNHSFGEVAERVPLTHPVTLDSGSTYYYRFYAHNTASETGWAASSATFATPASPVVLAGVGALPVGRESATLNGELVAGLIAEIEFSWGSDPDPENWDPGDVVSLGERSEGALFFTVGGLTPGMTYYYRIRAENEYGVDVLDPLVEFTTVSGLAWFGGGSYDGFDQQSFLDALRSTLGSLFIFR